MYNSSLKYYIPINKLATDDYANKRLMALDVGEKTIGIAISDLGRKIADPVCVIARSTIKQDSINLINLITKYDVCALVIGYPVRLDGSCGEAVRRVESFISSAQAFLKIPFCFWDERFSTAAAEHTMLSFDISRRKRSRKIDRLAATYFLQGALDFLQNYSAEIPG